MADPSLPNRKMSLITEELKAKAEVYYGNAICQERTMFLLQEVGLPLGLLPLKDIRECGYVEEIGFVWLKQRKTVDHCFEKIGRRVTYTPEITAYVDKRRITKLTGVKSKELMVWLTICEIEVDDTPTGRISFKTSSGLYRRFPTEAFEIEKEKPVSLLKPSGVAAIKGGGVA